MFGKFFGFVSQDRHSRTRLFSASKPMRPSRRQLRVEALESRIVLDITDMLVVHLTFDGNVLDQSGHGNDGTVVRPRDDQYVDGTIHGAFKSTDTYISGFRMAMNNYITLGHPMPGSDLDFGSTTDISFSYWGKIAPPPDRGVARDAVWISNKDWDSGGNIGYVLAYQGPTYTDLDGRFKWNINGDGFGSRLDA